MTHESYPHPSRQKNSSREILLSNPAAGENVIFDYLELPSYEFDGDRMKIRDVVWGESLLGEEEYDELLIRLAKTPAFKRMQAIEQLTLGPDYATMPNSMFFSRWQHLWGSVVFVRKMLEGEPLSPREKMIMQLRTLLSDVGHTAFSHLGDWLFQTDGKEDLHDQDLMNFIELVGIKDLLEEYDITVEEVIFPDTQDWIECSAPNLNVDRLDYSLREILRWVDPHIYFGNYRSTLKDPKRLFAIQNDGTLAITNLDFARRYSAAYGILSTEHWVQPVHRLQLQLFQMAVKMALLDEIELTTLHPREALYGVDSDFQGHFNQWELLWLHDTMKGLAADQRRIFVQARSQDLTQVFASFGEKPFPDFPDPLRAYSWQTRDFYSAPYPQNVLIEEVAFDHNRPLLASEKFGLQVHLPPLKARFVDPLVTDSAGNTQPLSKIDPSYPRFLEGQKQIMGKSYVATLLMRGDWVEKMLTQHHHAEVLWRQSLNRPRNDKTLLTKINETGERSGNVKIDNVSGY